MRAPEKPRSPRPKRKREESPAQQGVASAQRVLAALLAKDEAPKKAKT